MKILYYTNTKYAWEVQGTMKSIAEEVQARGHEVILRDKKHIKGILKLIKDNKPDMIWLASSDLTILNYKPKIKIPVVGFGFSDPYYFTTDRFNSYDIYVTNHEETINKYSSLIPMIYNPTACDIKFHCNMNLSKTIDISMIGTTNHPRFKDHQMRSKVVDTLRKDGFTVHAYGDGWVNNNSTYSNFNHPSIKGKDFLSVINKSKIGLDLQDDDSPLAHRMLEYGACGSACITKNRKEVYNLFEKDEIIVYNDYEDLKHKLNFYLSNPNKLIEVTKRFEKKCLEKHNISNRIDNLLIKLKNYLDFS